VDSPWQVLSAITSAVYAAAPPPDTFEVFIIRTHDVVPSMASLLLWPPRIPHTQYVLQVNASGSAPFLVVKRYNDFKTLHMRAEQDGVRLAVGASLELPGSLGSLGGLDSFAPFGSDPGVVALRRVGLQRYLDLLACSGCPYAIAHLRVKPSTLNP